MRTLLGNLHKILKPEPAKDLLIYLRSLANKSRWVLRQIRPVLNTSPGPNGIPAHFPVAEILARRCIAFPFLDPIVERRPWKRPVAMGAYAFVFFVLIALGLRSQYVDKHDPAVAQQLAKQKTEEENYMRKPFEPELSSASLAAANVTLADPLAAKGKSIFEVQSCNACHGDAGVGTAAGPPLVGIATKFKSDELAELLKHPSARMTAGGMPAVDLPPEDLKTLIAYLQSLK